MISTKSLAVNTIGILVATLVACSASGPSDGSLGGADSNQTAAPAGSSSGSVMGSTPPPASSSSSNNGSGTGSNTGTGTGTGTGSTPTGSADDAGGGGSTPTPSVDGGAGGTAATCSSSATIDACYTCCDPQNATGPADDAFGDCACTTPGTCKTECGSTYCAGKDPSAACITCLNGADACNTAADKVCNANAACATAQACVTGAGCDSKTQ